ncbi:MAG TPA: vanadium-dependent haloperoxidase [Steroidobacteraceae bacterium]|nr:vanadium-dependent haloperoxidase [Steroidobacteraceae bacterium]
MFKLSLAASAVVAATLAAPSQATGAFRDREDPAVVREWNVLAEGTIPASAGPTLPRSYAMMHIAMFDAVNSIEGGYTAYRVRIPATRYASSEAAAAQAAHDVLVSLYPANTAKFDTALSTRLATIQPLRAQLGAQVGREVAKKILEWRTTDGWATPQSFAPPALPGVWQPTPPNFPAAAFVQAGDAKPFALPTPYYFLPRRPPALNSQEYADAVNEIKAIGGATSSVRTEEQTLSAKLWASVGYKENWGGVWNGVARDLTYIKNLSLIESTRMFALLNVSMMDGLQTAQASKYVFQVWRPVTAIQRAGEDMNPATDADPDWMPLLTTPAYPSYAGNMACIGAASARALALYFGTNDIPVSFQWSSTDGINYVARGFSGFWQMAEHQAASREYGGIHFHFDTTASQEVCPKVAGYVYANYMRPKWN